MGVVGHDGKAVALGGKMLSSPGGGGGTTDHRQLTHKDAADQHPISAITGLQDELDGKMPADTPIPQAVTEQTVAGWGFTKNTGTYSKPSTGIPKTDLESSVKTSLGKADTAMQPGDLADWAKASTKPSYTASEVGALPADTPIPEAVTDAHINSLIDAKLGVIENGYY